MASSRFLGGVCSLLALLFLAGCGEDQSQGTPLQASVSPTVGCKGAQGYQHTTLNYHLCYPSGWIARDYTAEPGSGGAVSVVAFGPPSAVPTHVPTSGSFTPPIEVRVVAGSKSDVEQSLIQGNQVTATTVGGIAADKISVVDAGAASGTVIVVFEHQANTYELEEAPGGAFDGPFQHLVASFGFATS